MSAFTPWSLQWTHLSKPRPLSSREICIWSVAKLLNRKLKEKAWLLGQDVCKIQFPWTSFLLSKQEGTKTGHLWWMLSQANFSLSGVSPTAHHHWGRWHGHFKKYAVVILEIHTRVSLTVPRPGLCCAAQTPWPGVSLSSLLIVEEPAGSPQLVLVITPPVWDCLQLTMKYEVLKRMLFLLWL